MGMLDSARRNIMGNNGAGTRNDERERFVQIQPQMTWRSQTPTLTGEFSTRVIYKIRGVN